MKDARGGPVGRMHALQSLGAVDGPGLRCVVFLQGCPLRCVYCHNPDTWDAAGGSQVSVEGLLARVERFRPYFGEAGGVTVSGGEPLLQADFVAAFFEACHGEGIHTVLDTAGIRADAAAAGVLAHTDLVLADLKFPDDGAYRANTGGSWETVEAFLALTTRMDIPIWGRHVVVPGLTDTPRSIKRIAAWAKVHPNLQKMEWLPYHTLSLEKYEQLGISYPLLGTPALSEEALAGLLAAAGQGEG